MPRMDELVETIGAALLISTIDLTKRYWQMAMDPKEQSKTAFVIRKGPLSVHSLSNWSWESPSYIQKAGG